MFRSDDQVLSMLPGPCVLREPVLRALGRQSEAYFQPYFDEQFVDPLLAKLKRAFETTNLTFIVSGGGRAGLETAAMSTVRSGDRVVVLSGGIFGDELEALSGRAGAEVVRFELTPDGPLDIQRLREVVHQVRPVVVAMVHNETSTGSLLPIRDACQVAHEVDAITLVDSVSSLGGIECATDAWGVDLNVTASQKCLEGPAGIGIVSVSERAWKRIETAPEPCRAWTHDLRAWKTHWLPVAAGGGNPHRGRAAPLVLPSQLVCALSAGLDLVLAEGLKPRIDRHQLAGRALERGLEALGMALIAGANASSIVKCVRIPSDIPGAAVLETMLVRHRIRISGAFGRSDCVRVSAMGVTAEIAPILATLAALEDTLVQLGGTPAPGAGVHAAEATFRAGLHRA